MKIISYNVNGIRSALSKNFGGWLVQTMPDILCLQEIKATPEQFDQALFNVAGYPAAYWYPAQKKGYSGTAILSRVPADNVVYGCGHPDYDAEGRVIRADFGDLTVLSVYHPSGSSGPERQQFKMVWLAYFLDFVAGLLQTRPNLVISGDFNICHEEKDIHNPKGLSGASGFLPEEREWLRAFLDIGMVDTFRYMNPEQVAYSWWSFRAGSRARNKGWRIDYNMVSESLRPFISDAYLLKDAVHSDHCPAVVELHRP